MHKLHKLNEIWYLKLFIHFVKNLYVLTHNHDTFNKTLIP